jgi:hypothetical protein
MAYLLHIILLEKTFNILLFSLFTEHCDIRLYRLIFLSESCQLQLKEFPTELFDCGPTQIFLNLLEIAFYLSVEVLIAQFPLL